MKMFFETWQKEYDARKYPRELYYNSILAIERANEPDIMAKAIINMLHWKDGKVYISQNNKYIFSKTKPNIYNPYKHNEIFKSWKFFNWAKSLNKSNSFNPKSINDITMDFCLWNDSSVVMPAFLLHIINPFIYPLYDQNVERAKRILTAKGFNERLLTIESYIEYKNFFASISYINSNDKIKYIDEALWSFGKWLKQFVSKKKTNAVEKLGKVKAVGYRTNVNKGIYTPDADFKNEVMELVRIGLTQLNAMKKVAGEFGVNLPNSYYTSPSTHINRWRKQGF